METKTIFSAATSLLAATAALGLVLAGFRFLTDRRSPTWLARVHGLAAAASILMLTYGWSLGDFSRTASFGLAILWAAAVGGVTLSRCYRVKNKPLPELLVFLHMSAAFVGALVISLVLVSYSA